MKGKLILAVLIFFSLLRILFLHLVVLQPLTNESGGENKARTKQNRHGSLLLSRRILAFPTSSKRPPRDAPTKEYWQKVITSTGGHFARGNLKKMYVSMVRVMEVPPTLALTQCPRTLEQRICKVFTRQTCVGRAQSTLRRRFRTSRIHWSPAQKYQFSHNFVLKSSAGEFQPLVPTFISLSCFATLSERVPQEETCLVIL